MARRVSEMPAGLTYDDNVLNGAVPLFRVGSENYRVKVPSRSSASLYYVVTIYHLSSVDARINYTTRDYWLPLTCTYTVKSVSVQVAPISVLVLPVVFPVVAGC